MCSKRSTVIAMLLLLGHGVVWAGPVLQQFEPRNIKPGDLLEQAVKWQEIPGQRLEFTLIKAPDAARLDVTENGELVLKWDSGPDMAETTNLVIQVRDVDTSKVVDTGTLLVRNALMFESPENTAIETPLRTEIVNSGTESSESSAPASPVNTAAIVQQTQDRARAGDQPIPSVSLKQPVGEIVSAGKRVKIQIRGSSSDAEPPLLSLDRIPRNASFERSGEGRYTFFWQTSDRDQGEHRFRVTAVHPENEAVVVSREFTVVVGDPSRGTTVPSEADDDSS